MNSCIFLADIVQDPQLRYTADNLAIAEMMVQIEGTREGEPPAQLKAIGWGNLAQEIQEQYHAGDRILIEGRLSMNTVDRPEGFKEKRAEVTVRRLHRLGSGGTVTSYSAPVATTAATPSRLSSPPPAAKTVRQELPQPAYAAPSTDETNFDDIPF
ncbi:MAG: single-stranded DNA-binding protein [Synechococcales cyanobacterium T60_A2020_003]|nr:single-stranded DNA-binding protein [Synechococcales cyanobacterium T60_A2020_003]